jgi:hypothetical protein
VNNIFTTVAGTNTIDSNNVKEKYYINNYNFHSIVQSSTIIIPLIYLAIEEQSNLYPA